MKKLSVNAKIGLGFIAGVLITMLLLMASPLAGNFTGALRMVSKKDTLNRNVNVEKAVDLTKMEKVVESTDLKFAGEKNNIYAEEEKVTEAITVNEIDITQIQAPCQNDAVLYNSNDPAQGRFANFSALFNNIQPDSQGNVRCPLQFHTFVNTGSNFVDVICNKIQKHIDHEPGNGKYYLSCYDDNNNRMTLQYEYNVITQIFDSLIDFHGDIDNGDRMSVYTEGEPAVFQIFEKTP